MTYLSSKYPNFHNFITFYPFCAGVRDTRFWLAIIMGLSYCIWYLYSILIKFSDDLIIRIHYRLYAISIGSYLAKYQIIECVFILNYYPIALNADYPLSFYYFMLKAKF